MRSIIHTQAKQEHFYFVVFVASAEGSSQTIDNGVIGHYKAIDSLSDIRTLETKIRERSHGVGKDGGMILGSAGIRIRIIDYKRIRRE